MQNDGHYAVQDHLRLRFWYQSKARARVRLSISTNLHLILHNVSKLLLIII